MVLIIAIRAQAVFLIISWMTRHFLIGMDLFDMVGDVFINDRRRCGVAGAVLGGSHGRVVMDGGATVGSST